MAGVEMLRAFCTLTCLTYLVEAQNILVTCFTSGNQCNETEAGSFQSSYADCCTQQQPEMTYYRIVRKSNCIHCGPAIDEDRVKIIGAAQTTVGLSWQLRKYSLPVRAIRVTHREVADTNESLPIDLESDIMSQQFINLVENRTFEFSLQALGFNYNSPVVTKWFFVGQISVISLTNLTIEPSTFTKDTETATVFWVLENAGFPPITHFEIQWKDVPPAELIDESTFTDLGFLGTFPPENTANISLYHSPSLEGTRFNHTIHVQDKTRYVIYVRALNDDETNIGYIFFVFDTSGVIEPTTTVMMDIPVGVMSRGISVQQRSFLLVLLALTITLKCLTV